MTNVRYIHTLNNKWIKDMNQRAGHRPSVSEGQREERGRKRWGELSDRLTLLLWESLLVTVKVRFDKYLQCREGLSKAK